MDKNKTQWLILGGGFRSMVAAYALSKSGEKVVLVEKSHNLGGFMTPIKWKDFWIDKGPQFFDNFEATDRVFF